MAQPDFFLALAGEDEAHHFAVTRLTDRLLTEHFEWLAGVVEGGRTWREPHEGRPWFALRRAGKTTDGRSQLPHGRFGSGESGAIARKAEAQLRAWKDMHDRGDRLDAVIIATDLDRKDRLPGLREAIETRPWPFTVVLAWFQPEAEAWFICGHVPRSAGQREAHATLRQRLGFCPIEQPHRLLSTRDDSVKDAKLVWTALSRGDPEARQRSLQADLAVLRRNGAEAGLADFLDQLTGKLVPRYRATLR